MCQEHPSGRAVCLAAREAGGALALRCREHGGPSRGAGKKQPNKLPRTKTQPPNKRSPGGGWRLSPGAGAGLWDTGSSALLACPRSSPATEDVTTDGGARPPPLPADAAPVAPATARSTAPLPPAGRPLPPSLPPSAGRAVPAPGLPPPPGKGEGALAPPHPRPSRWSGARRAP